MARDLDCGVTQLDPSKQFPKGCLLFKHALADFQLNSLTSLFVVDRQAVAMDVARKHGSPESAALVADFRQVT